MCNLFKTSVLGLALIVIGNLTFASAQSTTEFAFAGTPWYASADAVVEHLTSAGYSVTDGSIDDGDGLSFEGTLMNKEALILALFNDQDELLKVATYLMTSDAADEFNTAEEAYNSLKTLLTDRYGEPKNSFEYFKDPYYRGDGYEDTAIRSGNATFTTYWEDNQGTFMALQIDEDVDVAVIYESARWGEYLDQQEAESSADF